MFTLACVSTNTKEGVLTDDDNHDARLIITGLFHGIQELPVKADARVVRPSV